MIEVGPRNLRLESSRSRVCMTIGVGRDIAQVADVPFRGVGTGMHFVCRVEVSTGCHAVFGPDAEFVDVEPVIACAGAR